MRALLVASIGFLLSACEAPCSSDASCDAPAVCGPEKRCVIPPPADDGAACSHDAHCKGGACLFAPEGNTCATACAEVTACTSERCAPTVDHRPDGDRLRFTCQPASPGRFLSETCVADADCRSGFCQAGHCSSPCGACPSSLTCQPATVTREALSLDVGVCSFWPELATLELGAVDTPASGTATLTFELPATATAFTIVVEDFDDRVPVISRLLAPTGAVFVGNPSDGGTRDLARPSSGRGQATMLVPGTDDARARPAPGTWTIELATFDPMNFPAVQRQLAGRVERVAVVLKRAEPGGVVDLTVHVAPETTFAPDGSFVSTLLDSLDGLLRNKVGATLGEVQVLRLPADAGSSIGTSLQANQLWAEYSRDSVGARPVNLFLVKELTFAGGVAGGVPGPPKIYRRPGTGVVVTPLASGAQASAVLASHELLHFLGLSHTSDEFRGPDLISDTPSCANPTGNGCPDERNLMFPYFPTREPLTISAGQRAVLEGSPWLYHAAHPLACAGVDAIAIPRQRFLTSSTSGPRAALTTACGGSGNQRAHLLRLERPASRLDVRVTGAGFTPIASLRRGDCASPEVSCAIADGGTAALRVANPPADAWFVLVDSIADGGTYSLTVDVTP